MLRLPISETCWLRLLEEADAAELSALVDENRTYLSRWMPWASGQTLEGTLDFIRMTRRQVPGSAGFQAAVVSDRTIIGVAGFPAVDWTHRTATIGYWLAERHQGHGTMTRVVSGLVDHAFGTWQLHRVEIRAAPENRRSRAIPERLGFREEGTLREAERFGERYLDSVVYGMLAADWKSADR